LRGLFVNGSLPRMRVEIELLASEGRGGWTRATLGWWEESDRGLPVRLALCIRVSVPDQHSETQREERARKSLLVVSETR